MNYKNDMKDELQDNKNNNDEMDLRVSNLEAVKELYNRLHIKDFVIILLVFIMVMIYVLMSREIDACNAHYMGILRNTTKILTYI